MLGGEWRGVCVWKGVGCWGSDPGPYTCQICFLSFQSIYRPLTPLILMAYFFPGFLYDCTLYLCFFTHQTQSIFFYYFGLAFGPSPAVLRGYTWLVFRVPYLVLGFCLQPSQPLSSALTIVLAQMQILNIFLLGIHRVDVHVPNELPVRYRHSWYRRKQLEWEWVRGRHKHNLGFSVIN